MSNAAAMGKLREHIRRVRTLPGTLPEIARVVVGEVRSIMAANVAAQRGPDGKPWPRTEDGKPALVHAMQSVDVRAIGTTVVMSVDGIEGRHHIGNVKGGRSRAIIPSRKTPEPMTEALDRAHARVTAAHMDGK